MYVVRDNRQRGRAVTWGSNRDRMTLVASWDPAYELWVDGGARRTFWHVEMGWNRPHPYDIPHRFLAMPRH